jgi:hypothetical protein
VIKASGTVELLTVDAASNRPTAVSIIESVIDILERSPDIAERIKAMIMTFKTEETPVSPELSE